MRVYALKTVDFKSVREMLGQGCRVLLLVRHAERPRIDPEDPTFGCALPLTENGMRMCVEFGRALAGATDDVQFRASPLRRTILTAEGIAEGMGLDSPDIFTDDAIGNASAFVADIREIWDLFRDQRFFDHMAEYVRAGVQRGFAPLVPAAEAYESYLLSKFTGKLGIFATHDVFIASFLAGKGVKNDWNPSNWPRFLDAAAIAIDPAGVRRVAFFRAGLSDRATGV